MEEQINELQIALPGEADGINGGVEANANDIDEGSELSFVGGMRVLVHDVDNEVFLLINFSNKEKMRGGGRSFIDERRLCRATGEECRKLTYETSADDLPAE